MEIRENGTKCAGGQQKRREVNSEQTRDTQFTLASTPEKLSKGNCVSTESFSEFIKAKRFVVKKQVVNTRTIIRLYSSNLTIPYSKLVW